MKPIYQLLQQSPHLGFQVLNIVVSLACVMGSGRLGLIPFSQHTSSLTLYKQVYKIPANEE